MQNNVAAVIVAAGRGTRLGATIPKAFITLAGEPLLRYSLRTFDSHQSITRIILVVPADYTEMTATLIRDARVTATPSIVSGGSERWESVRNGVQAAQEDADWVLVHDAARPFVTTAIIDAVLEQSESYRAVVTATEVADTIREYDGHRAGRTVDRSGLVRVGTPQLFHRPTLTKAFEFAGAMDTPPTDEAVLMEKMGVAVGIAWGDALNFKITTPQDLRIAEAIVDKDRSMLMGG